MLFRKQGKVIEIVRCQFKTDKDYYTEIYRLQLQLHEDDVKNHESTSISKPTFSTFEFVSNLLLKDHAV